jgi:hypothetical protein
MILQAILIYWEAVLTFFDPTAPLEAEIERLQHERDTEQRRADALMADKRELEMMLADGERTMRQAGYTISRHLAESVRV